MEGTIRSRSPERCALLGQRVHEIAEGVAAMHHGCAELVLCTGEPPVINDIEMMRRFPQLVYDAAGREAFCDGKQRANGSDDFVFDSACIDLLHGQSFFTRDLVTLEEAADRTIAKEWALFAQVVPQFLDGDIRRRLEQSHDRGSMGIHPVRLAIAALSSRLGIALLPLARSPAAYAGRADAKSLGGLPA